MQLVADVLVGLVALAHVYFMVLEMFLWTRPFGRKVFGNSEAKANDTAVLAKNQGLYNGFLAAALVWALVARGALYLPVVTFVLGCVIVAGIYGAITANRRILFVQALPALLALVAVHAA